MFYRYRTLLTAAIIFFSLPVFSQFNKWLPVLEKQAATVKVVPADLKAASVFRSYTDEKTGITFIYLQQRYQDIKVLDAVLSVALKDDQVLYSAGRFLPVPRGNSAARTKTIVQPMDAVRKAADHLQLRSANLRISADRYIAEKKYKISADSMARQDVTAEQYWHLDTLRKQLRLVWNIGIDDLYSDNYWQVRVDAMDGTIIDKQNLTIYENEVDSEIKSQNPVHWPASIAKPSFKKAAPLAPLQADYLAIQYPGRDAQVGTFYPILDPWTIFGPGNPATTLGWHSTATEDFNITRGNNVFAFLGTNPSNVPDPITNWPDTAVVDGTRLQFMTGPDWSTAPNDSINRSNKKSAIVNLFYWSNLIHDFTYQYGFTEAAGNFQSSNLGRGGVEGDHVMAQAQDGSGMNNANFYTPADGENGRMRMYLWENIYFRVDGSGQLDEYDALEGKFSAPNKITYLQDVSALLVRYFNDAPGTQHPGCVPHNNLAGKMAVIDATRRPGCASYTEMVINAQNAGAVGLVIVGPNNTPFTAIGNEPTITIPVVTISNAAGMSVLNRLADNEYISGTMINRQRDASLDNTVTAHEYMHGITNRMTGGGAVECLGNAEQAGEGWSDFLAIMMTTDWENPFSSGTFPSGVGVYVDEKILGIRRFPYSTDMSVNPLTYADFPSSATVHRRGEIWCSALWDMTWEIIAQRGGFSGGFLDNTGNGGNVIAMNLVMTALKLQPCQPGFIDSRDAILAADSILYNKEFHCAIWRAFAKRGMGFNAKQGSPQHIGDETVDFSLPLSIFAMSDTSVQNGENLTITRKVRSACLPTDGYIFRDTIPAGFSFVGSTPAAVLQGNILEFPAIDMIAGEEKTFTITLQATSPGCPADTVLHDNRDGKSLGNFTSTIEMGPTQGWKAAAGGKSGQGWFAEDTTIWTLTNLASEPSSLTIGKNISLFSFNHRYNIEEGIDAGKVQYSADGVTWFDMGPYFIKNGYPAETGRRFYFGERIFTGNSNGWHVSVADISALGTTPIRIRFSFANESEIGGGGWMIDDIMRVNYCGSVLRSGMYNAQNGQLMATAATTIYFGDQPTALPLTLISFEAKEDGSSNRLQWKTASEEKVKEFDIEFSHDGASWSTIGSVAAHNQTTNHYSYIHKNPALGMNYYRLKMKDIDGKYTYSPIEVVRRYENEKYFTLQPNPARGTAQFYFSPSLRLSSIRIYDGAGRLVKQEPINSGSSRHAISLKGIAPGMYVAEGIGQAGKELVRFAVQN